MSSRSLLPILGGLAAGVAVGAVLAAVVALQPVGAAAAETSPTPAVTEGSATDRPADAIGTPGETASGAAEPSRIPRPSPVPAPSVAPTGAPHDIATQPLGDVGSLPHSDAALLDGPLDPAAVRAGFARSPYTFTATVTGFPSYGAMGGTWTGRVTDPRHYDLRFPAGGSLTRYRRSGDTGTSYLGDLAVSAAAGDPWDRTPDDLLPLQLYAAAIEPWTGLLPERPRGDAYIADVERLTAAARHRGLEANRWSLAVAVDADGRLTSAVLAGRVRTRAFRMELRVAYDAPAQPASTAGEASGATQGPSLNRGAPPAGLGR